MKPRTELKAGLIVLGLLLVSPEAHAISRYISTSMSCVDIRATVQAEGAAVFRWTQAPDIQRYGRFVAHGGYCDFGERAEWSYIPAADRQSCAVNECKRYDPHEFDFFFHLRQR